MRIKQSLKIVTILTKEVVKKNAEFSEYLNVMKQISSLLSDLEKVDENKAEFENGDNLKKRSC